MNEKEQMRNESKNNKFVFNYFFFLKKKKKKKKKNKIINLKIKKKIV